MASLADRHVTDISKARSISLKYFNNISHISIMLKSKRLGAVTGVGCSQVFAGQAIHKQIHKFI